MPVSGNTNAGPGLAFVGCEISAGASASSGGGSGHAHAHAKRWEVVIAGKRIKTVSKGHLIAQDGHWRWTLSDRSLSALLAGACP